MNTFWPPVFQPKFQPLHSDPNFGHPMVIQFRFRCFFISFSKTCFTNSNFGVPRSIKFKKDEGSQDESSDEESEDLDIVEENNDNVGLEEEMASFS